MTAMSEAMCMMGSNDAQGSEVDLYLSRCKPCNCLIVGNAGTNFSETVK